MITFPEVSVRYRRTEPLTRPSSAPAKRAELSEANDDVALEQTAPTLIATAADLAAKERLEAISGRITGSGLLTLAGLVLIVVLMVVKPFGS